MPIAEFETHKGNPLGKGYICKPCSRLKSSGAGTRKRDWRKLSYTEMVAINNSRTDCIYCHIPFTPENPSTKDRKDPSGNYTTENTVLACRDCNVMKSNIVSYDEMLLLGELLAKIKARRAGGGDEI